MNERNYSPDITNYADRYGTSDHELFRDTGKSGLTPIRPAASEDSLSPRSALRAKRHERYQRRHLQTFSTWELQDQGCLIKEDAKPCDLVSQNFPLHPMIERNRWGSSKIPIGDGYDAVLHGERRVLPSNTFSDGGDAIDLCSVHMRSPQEFAASGGRMHEIFLKMAKSMSFYIHTGRVSPNGVPVHVNGSHTVKFENGQYTGSGVWIAWENVKPLLGSSLLDSERLVQQFFITKTLIHEITHAAVKFLDVSRVPSMSAPEPEPFMEDEEINECGWSIENAIFGGTIHSLYRAENGEPAMGLLLTNWVDFKRHYKYGQSSGTNVKRKRFRHPERFGEGSKSYNWPIQVVFVENLQQQEFWKVQVGKFDVNAFFPPRIFGRFYTKGKDGKPGRAEMMLGPDYERWTAETGRQLQALYLQSQSTLNHRNIGRDDEIRAKAELVDAALLSESILGKHPRQDDSSGSENSPKRRG